MGLHRRMTNTVDIYGCFDTYQFFIDTSTSAIGLSDRNACEPRAGVFTAVIPSQRAGFSMRAFFSPSQDEQTDRQTEPDRCFTLSAMDAVSVIITLLRGIWGKFHEDADKTGAVGRAACGR